MITVLVIRSRQCGRRTFERRRLGEHEGRCGQTGSHKSLVARFRVVVIPENAKTPSYRGSDPGGEGVSAETERFELSVPLRELHLSRVVH